MRGHEWIRIVRIAELPLREGRAVVVGGRELALFNLGDCVLAVDNECPHKGGPLCDGIVTGRSVVCPLHGWKANLETGAIERPKAALDHCVTTYETRVIDGIVAVALEKGGRE
jgi:nitrite reductase (NADH) small subunit